MSLHEITLTGSQRGVPPHLAVKEPNFSKLISSLVNIGYPPGTLRRKYCIDYFVKGASFALALTGTILITSFIGKSLLNHPQESALTVVSLVALLTLVKIGQKIATHFQNWKESEYRLRDVSASFLKPGSLQKYAASHLGQLFVQASYLTGSLFVIYLAGSVLDYPNQFLAGLFITFDCFVLILAVGVLISGAEAMRLSHRHDQLDIEKGEIQKKAVEEPPPESLSSSSLQPIPSKMLESLKGLQEIGPLRQSN